MTAPTPRRLLVAATTLALLLGTPLQAIVPGQMDFQGLLLDAGGSPVNGAVDLTFTLYDAPSAGNPLWTESHPSVQVVDGVYDVPLGATSPLTPGLLSAGSVYLEIEVSGETLSPRRQLLAVPYALHAETAEALIGDTALFVDQVMQHFSFDGGAPANDDPSEGLGDADGDGIANFLEADNDDDGIPDTVELGQGSDINLVTPVITGFSPTIAPGASTTPITILGTDFEPGMTVQFGVESPIPTNPTPTSMDVLVGPHPVGTASVTVTRTSNGEAASADFDFEQTLSITGFDPPWLIFDVGGTVTVQGAGFEAAMSVDFGTESPTPSNLTPTSFDVTLGPQPAGLANVTLTRDSNGESANTSFEFRDDRVVFFSGGAGDGNLGGVAGADAICAAAATTLGLPGTYLAWIADSTTSPALRFYQHAGPYVRPDGTKIADGWADLTDGSLDAAVVEVGGIARTNVAADGTALSGDHCADFSSTTGTSSVGNATTADGAWTNSGTHPCSAGSGLYCFQQ
jgi:hypothetical protein